MRSRLAFIYFIQHYFVHLKAIHITLPSQVTSTNRRLHPFDNSAIVINNNRIRLDFIRLQGRQASINSDYVQNVIGRLNSNEINIHFSFFRVVSCASIFDESISDLTIDFMRVPHVIRHYFRRDAMLYSAIKII